jgi:predicted dehydrogenase
MKFLVIGLGSMGKRRIRNLLKLKEKDIIGFDVRQDRRLEAQEKYGIKTLGSFDEAIAIDHDVQIISVPPGFHLEYALKAVKNDKHFFCEAPLSTTLEGLDELIELSRKSGKVAAPSCNMCFHPSIRLLKEFVERGELGKVLCLIYELGHYLPDWHPYEDYRTYYVVHKEHFGGGWDVFPMELVWLLWMFGEIETVTCIAKKLSSLEIDVEDSQDMLLEFKSGLIANLHFDAIQRVWTGRHLKLISEEGTAIWDSSEGQVKLFKVKDKKWQTFPEPEGLIYSVKGIQYSMPIAEEMYVKEIEHFLKAIHGEEKYLIDLNMAKRIAQTVQAAQESSNKGVRMRI